MANPHRLSITPSHDRGASVGSINSPTYIPAISDVELWLENWSNVPARELMDTNIVKADADMTVEEACDALLQHNTTFLAVQSSDSCDKSSLGLFDFADVNAFLTLAATRRQLSQEHLSENPKLDQIVQAAHAGKVPVLLVSNLSEKNPLASILCDATIIDLLKVFSSGIHRCFICSETGPDNDNDPYYLGFVSDSQLLVWFEQYATRTPSFQDYLSNGTAASTSAFPIHHRTGVVSCSSEETVLTAMKKMSHEGVSSVAIVQPLSASGPASGPQLLSAVSVTDIGRIVVPSPDNQILTRPLHQFITLIKEPDGSKDGADKYPVYVIQPTSRMSYIVEKLLATNAHRLFVSDDAMTPGGGLRGVISLVDILSLFARLAKIPNVDPGTMRMHRRDSSTSTNSSSSARSRSTSRASRNGNPSESVPVFV